MNDIRFDTLKAARDLKAAGLEEAHAEAIVATMGRAMSENLATKTDIKELEQAITNLERATKTDTKPPGQTINDALAAFEYRITIRLGLLNVAGVAYLAALIILS